MPRITDDTAYPVLASLTDDDELAVLDGGATLKKVTAATMGGASADNVCFVSTSGSDSNSGRSPALAKATLAAALTAGARRVVLGAGTYSIGSGISLGSSRCLVIQGAGLEETTLDFSTLTGSATALNLTGGGFRGASLENLTVKGPGSGTSVTGVKPYSGFAPRNIRIRDFGVGMDLGTNVGVHLDLTVEFLTCGLGVSTTVNGNKHNIGARFLTCGKGISVDVNQINIRDAWFEGCTDTEVEIRDARSVNVVGCWFENTRATPEFIKLTPDSTAYLATGAVNIEGNFFQQNTAGAAFMSVVQATAVRVVGNAFANAAYANISVSSYLSDLTTANNYATVSDGETDRSARVAVGVTGAGKLVDVSAPPSLASRQWGSVFPFVAGTAVTASANLLSDSGFESALSAVAAGGGASLPTVTWDTDANLGAKSCKASFPAASVGSTMYLQIDRNFSATSGQPYILEFSAKANKAFRMFTLRMQTTGGAFEGTPTTFIDLSTEWRRFRMLWVAPSTATYRMAFYKNTTTTNAVDLWIDDVAVYAGAGAGVYLPGVATAVPKGVTAAARLAIPSPNGTLWEITVDNAGAISTTSL